MQQLLQSLSATYNGELYVFSHSMGAIAVSEALRLQSQSGGVQIAKVYVPSPNRQPLIGDGNPHPRVHPDAPWPDAHPPGGRSRARTETIYRCLPSCCGGAGGSKSVGSIVNFYHENDWALAAPIWQFGQITKPDYRDTLNDQPNLYDYDALVSKFGRINVLNGRTFLEPGTRADPADRYEITAFAAESRVKAFGATPSLTQGITESINLATVWGADPRGGDHKAHVWHSGQFRSIMPYQKNYWRALLDSRGFGITEGVLP